MDPFGTPLGVAKSLGFSDVANLLLGKGGATWNDDAREMFEPSVMPELPEFIEGEESDGEDLLEDEPAS